MKTDGKWTLSRQEVMTMGLLLRDGLEVQEHYLRAEICASLVQAIQGYASATVLPLIERVERQRSLRYRVIDGDVIKAALPQLAALYEDMLTFVRNRDSRLVPLADTQARLNVNVISRGGEYRWHYDRNAVTAIVFLNSVGGGETEMFPRYRLHLGRWRHTRLQRFLDRIFLDLRVLRRPVTIPPQAGTLILMCGDRCLHSVRPVSGNDERISVIMAFDLPNARFRAEAGLDSYLYSPQPHGPGDPNYR